MNICIDLDPGGAPSDTTNMSAAKTVTVDSSFSGIVIIEAKCGGDWVPVPDLSFQAPGSKTIEAVFQEARVVGSFSGGPSVSITADDGGAQFVELPSNGDSVDTDTLGSKNTILVAGLVAGDLLKVETSDDNVNFAEACTFQNDGLKTLTIVACWMRVVYAGSGAPSICVGAANAIAFVVTQPLGPLVFRPGTVGQLGMTEADLPGGRVKNTAQEIADALEVTQHYGGRRVEVDNRFAPPSPSNIVGAQGINAANWPLLAADYPFESVELGSYFVGVGGPDNHAMEFEDGVIFRGIKHIGNGRDVMQLIYNGLVNDGPFRTAGDREGFNIGILAGAIYNTVVGAKPMFAFAENADPGFLDTTGSNGALDFGGVGSPGPEPIVDLPNVTFAFFNGHGDTYDGAFTSSVVGTPNIFHVVARSTGDNRDKSGVTWSNPAYEAAGGTYTSADLTRTARNRVQSSVIADAAGGLLVLGQRVKCDTTAAAANSFILTLAESVGPRRGCDWMFKDSGGQADVAGKEINIRVQINEFLEDVEELGGGESNQVMSTAFGAARGWSDGFGNFWIDYKS